MKEYKRDGRAPKPRTETISRVMSANKAKDTGPELAARKVLRELGARGYRFNPKNIPGRPDIVFSKNKLAIFIHGCFWHKCPYCKNKLPKTHTAFWRNKFESNKLSDKEKITILKKDGWKTLVIWECQIEKRTSNIIDKLKEILRVGVLK